MPAPEAIVIYPEIVHLDRASVILRIRLALQARSGRPWSVRGGAGTAYGWIQISSPPRRCTDGGDVMTDEERAELGELLGLDRSAHTQGEAIPDGHDWYIAFIDRAEGRLPRVTPSAYWD